MGPWQAHRQRQAGKYAKASYRLARAQYENSPEAQANRAAWAAHGERLAEQSRARDLERWESVKSLLGRSSVPERPDLD